MYQRKPFWVSSQVYAFVKQACCSIFCISFVLHDQISFFSFFDHHEYLRMHANFVTLRNEKILRNAAIAIIFPNLFILHFIKEICLNASKLIIHIIAKVVGSRVFAFSDVILFRFFFWVRDCIKINCIIISHI